MDGIGRDPGTRLLQKMWREDTSKDGDWDNVLGGHDLNETQQLGTPYGPTGGASPEAFC